MEKVMDSNSFQSQEGLVESVRNELEAIDAMDVNAHAVGFEAIHKNLADALSAIDGL